MFRILVLYIGCVWFYTNRVGEKYWAYKMVYITHVHIFFRKEAVRNLLFFISGVSMLTPSTSLIKKKKIKTSFLNPKNKFYQQKGNQFQSLKNKWKMFLRNTVALVDSESRNTWRKKICL